ncbi:hypothetical protein NPN18_26940, partial [Vibrio parahaemolyticus]|nr:hypothetical protein [Vibrio parahaemolyticus]
GDDGASGASGALVVVDGGPYGTRRRMSSDRVSFDSEDDDECDDVFAGTWNARTVARRRAEMIAAVRSDE